MGPSFGAPGRGPMVAFGLWVAAAHAAPPVGLSGPDAALWERAEAHEVAGDPHRAAKLYASLWERQALADAGLAAARALTAAGRRDDALRLLSSIPGDRDARAALGAALIHADRDAEAVAVLTEVEAIWGEDLEAAALLAEALAVVDPEAAAAALVRVLGMADDGGGWRADVAAAHAKRLRESGRVPAAAAGAVDPRAVIVAVVAARALDAGHAEVVGRALDAIAADFPAIAAEVSPLRDRAAMVAAARSIARLVPAPLTVAQIAEARRARDALGAGRIAESRAILEPLVDAAPSNPELRGLRARARDRDGAPELAELDLRAAEALDPLDARWPRELGDLLDARFGGRFADEVLDAWTRALRLRPDQPDLRGRQLRLAATLGRASTVLGALDPARDPSLAGLVEDLARPRAVAPPPPGGAGCAPAVPMDACEAFYLAFVYARRGLPARPGSPADRDVAIAEVVRAIDGAPAWTRPLNLRASLALTGEDASDRADATALLARSLELDPDQPDIEVVLGRLRQAAGDEGAAFDHWRRAAAADAPAGAPAHVYLAEAAWRRWRVGEAAAHLERYRALTLPGGSTPIDARAAELEERVAAIRAGALASGVAGALGAGAIGGALLWRRARRRSVADLLARDPWAYRDVARVASALRHEVLKHQLGPLREVAVALRAGDDRPARWLAGIVDDDDGPIARADRRFAELIALGSARGLALDVRGVDPVFGPLARALARLATLPDLVSRPDRAADLVASVDEDLRAGSIAIARLLADGSTVDVDRGLLAEVAERARRDATASWRDTVAIGVDHSGGSARVRAFRDDLIDVVVNLVRNAAAATEGAGAISLRVALDEDPITALRHVEIRVADRAPRRLTTAMIRGRYIERGLGLTVDLVGRMGGSVTVEPEPGFEKAVVVRLPLVEPVQEGGA